MGINFIILAWRISMDRAVWWATVDGVVKSQTQLSNYTCRAELKWVSTKVSSELQGLHLWLHR